MIINHYEDSSFESICHRLSRNDPSLTLINWNNKGIDGSYHSQLLSNALARNHHAIVLFLKQNTIKRLTSIGQGVQFLYLTGNPGIDVSSFGFAPELRVLTLSYCQLEDTESIIHFVSKCCPKLRKLDISGNPKLVAAMPDLIRRAAPYLESLDITGCCCSKVFADDDTSLDTNNTRLVELRMEEHVPSRWQYILSLNRAGRRHWGNVQLPAYVYPRIIHRTTTQTSVTFRLFRERPDLLLLPPR